MMPTAEHARAVIGPAENGASLREAAEHYEGNGGTSVIWVKRFREAGRCSAKPCGGSVSHRGTRGPDAERGSPSIKACGRRRGAGWLRWLREQGPSASISAWRHIWNVSFLGSLTISGQNRSLSEVAPEF
jgi:hypothetical protein